MADTTKFPGKVIFDGDNEFEKAVTIKATTDASSKTTGALKVAGGAGVEKKLHAGTGITTDSGGLTVTLGEISGGAGVQATTAAFSSTLAVSGAAALRGGFIFPQPTQEALVDDGAAITNANIAARIMTIAAGDARSKATPTGANMNTSLGLSVTNDSADLVFINTATTLDHVLTVTAGSNVTIVGSPLVYPRIDQAGVGGTFASGSIGSAVFRYRRTSSTQGSLYRLS